MAKGVIRAPKIPLEIALTLGRVANLINRIVETKTAMVIDLKMTEASAVKVAAITATLHHLRMLKETVNLLLIALVVQAALVKVQGAALKTLKASLVILIVLETLLA